MDFLDKMAQINAVKQIMTSQAKLLSIKNLSSSPEEDEYYISLEGQTYGFIKMISRVLILLAKEQDIKVQDIIELVNSTCEFMEYAECLEEAPKNTEELLNSLEQILKKSTDKEE